MNNIQINKDQSKKLAMVMIGDIKSHCMDNFERYWAWWFDEIRKAKGKPPLHKPSDYWGRGDS
jgi:hypothetical protein